MSGGSLSATVVSKLDPVHYVALNKIAPSYMVPSYTVFPQATSKNCVRYFEEGTPINSKKAKRGVFHFCFCPLIEISTVQYVRILP